MNKRAQSQCHCVSRVECLGAVRFTATVTAAMVTVTVTVTAATVTVTGTGQAWVGDLSGAVSSTFSLPCLVECWIVDRGYVVHVYTSVF